MKEYKRVKDPIYGYIQIPVKYMTDIVDTAEFQRLRRIIQTSYSPLYSSAVHNRFVHSMGVYYLGDLTVKRLKKEIAEKISIIKHKMSTFWCLFLWLKDRRKKAFLEILHKSN